MYVLVPYLAVFLMLALIQRKLIYHPTRVGAIAPEHAGLSAGQVHTIRVPAGDGVELLGWHVLADGCTADDHTDCDRRLAEGRPLVLYFPGNAGNRTYRVRHCLNFAGQDADVFLVDYRGYAENPGAPNEATLVADAQALWKYVTEQRNVDPSRIILFGESLGGGVAVQLASEVCRAGTPPGGLLLCATFSSLEDTAAWHYPWLPVRLVLLDRFLSVEHMPDVTCPVSHVHGAADTIVPMHLGRNLFETAPETSAGGVPKQFFELKGVGHNDVPHSAIRAAFAQLLRSIDGAKRPTAAE